MSTEEVLEIENSENGNKPERNGLQLLSDVQNQLTSTVNDFAENVTLNSVSLKMNVDASNLPSFVKINRPREDIIFGPKQRR